jgi:hypothetical protein
MVTVVEKRQHIQKQLSERPKRPFENWTQLSLKSKMVITYASGIKKFTVCT